jgi:hypothetical protein
MGYPIGCIIAGGIGNCVQARSGSMEERFFREKDMRRKPRTKLVQEGDYVAEVEVELLQTEEGWAPYLSVEDAYKLDDVRDALRRGDLQTATRLARVFKMTPVTMMRQPENESLRS